MILSVPEVLAQCGHQEQLKNVIIRTCYFSDQYEEGCFTTKQRKSLILRVSTKPLKVVTMNGLSLCAYMCILDIFHFLTL